MLRDILRFEHSTMFDECMDQFYAECVHSKKVTFGTEVNFKTALPF